MSATMNCLLCLVVIIAAGVVVLVVLRVLAERRDAILKVDMFDENSPFGM